MGLEFNENAVARMAKRETWKELSGLLGGLFNDLISQIPGVSLVTRIFGFLKEAEVKVPGVDAGQVESSLVGGINTLRKKVEELQETVLGSAKDAFDSAAASMAK